MRVMVQVSNYFQRENHALFFQLTNLGDCPFEEGVAYPVPEALNDGKKTLTDSAKACSYLCNLTPDCKFFTWNSDTMTCWLKKEIFDPEMRTTAISGTLCEKGKCSDQFKQLKHLGRSNFSY